VSVRKREPQSLHVPVIKVSPFKGTQQRKCLSLPKLRKETDPVSKTFCSLEYQMMDKVQKSSDSDEGIRCDNLIPGMAL
jgi:hypothetical protein